MENYKEELIKVKLIKKLKKLLYYYQRNSNYFEYKTLGEKIEFNEIYRYSVDDIKRIIEIYELQLEAKICGYKNNQRLNYTNKLSKFDKELWERIKKLDNMKFD